MRDPNALLEQIRSLPPNRVAEIEDFVAFIVERERERSPPRGAAAASEPAFAVIWDNPDDAIYDTL